MGDDYTLQRLSQSEEGTFGVLKDVPGNVLCHTAELPWNGNHPDTSCIPVGQYQVIPHNSVEHPHVWEITNVPNRIGILIHQGNLPLKDSLGCIIVGRTQGWLGTDMAVLNSMAALNDLRQSLPQSWIIDILDPTT